MITRGVKRFVDNFNRAQSFTTTPGMNGWTIKDTSPSGTPTYLCQTDDGGSFKLLLDNTNEAQVVTLYQNDVLIYDVRQLQCMWWVFKVAGVDAVTTITVGAGSAQNDTADSVATNFWGRIQGSVSTSALVVESDDGTNDIDDVATGKTVGSSYRKLLFDFTNGISDVRYYFDGDRVAANSGTASGRFDMSALTAGLNVQPFIQLQKASGTGIPSITGTEFGCIWNDAN